LWEPEWHEVHTMRKESRTTVDEFAKFGHGLYEVGVNKLGDPLGRFLTVLRLKLDFEYTIPMTQN
jgi:hypothetical protein